MHIIFLFFIQQNYKYEEMAQVQWDGISDIQNVNRHILMVMMKFTRISSMFSCYILGRSIHKPWIQCLPQRFVTHSLLFPWDTYQCSWHLTGRVVCVTCGALVSCSLLSIQICVCQYYLLPAVVNSGNYLTVNRCLYKVVDWLSDLRTLFC